MSSSKCRTGTTGMFKMWTGTNYKKSTKSSALNDDAFNVFVVVIPSINARFYFIPRPFITLRVTHKTQNITHKKTVARAVSVPLLSAVVPIYPCAYEPYKLRAPNCLRIFPKTITDTDVEKPLPVSLRRLFSFRVFSLPSLLRFVRTTDIRS